MRRKPYKYINIPSIDYLKDFYNDSRPFGVSIKDWYFNSWNLQTCHTIGVLLTCNVSLDKEKGLSIESAIHDRYIRHLGDVLGIKAKHSIQHGSRVYTLEIKSPRMIRELRKMTNDFRYPNMFPCEDSAPYIMAIILGCIDSSGIVIPKMNPDNENNPHLSSIAIPSVSSEMNYWLYYSINKVIAPMNEDIADTYPFKDFVNRIITDPKQNNRYKRLKNMSYFVIGGSRAAVFHSYLLNIYRAMRENIYHHTYTRINNYHDGDNTRSDIDNYRSRLPDSIGYRRIKQNIPDKIFHLYNPDITWNYSKVCDMDGYFILDDNVDIEQHPFEENPLLKGF